MSASSSWTSFVNCSSERQGCQEWPRNVQGPGALSLASKAMREIKDTSISFCDTIGCLQPCLIMMEMEPGCFECDIREDEMSHSNLALGRVPCSKGRFRNILVMIWHFEHLFITTVHSLATDTKLESICENHKLHSDCNTVSRSRGAQGFITLPT